MVHNSTAKCTHMPIYNFWIWKENPYTHNWLVLITFHFCISHSFVERNGLGMALIRNIQTYIVYIYKYSLGSAPSQTRKHAGSQHRALYSEYGTEDNTSVSCMKVNYVIFLKEDYRHESSYTYKHVHIILSHKAVTCITYAHLLCAGTVTVTVQHYHLVMLWVKWWV